MNGIHGFHWLLLSLRNNIVYLKNTAIFCGTDSVGLLGFTNVTVSLLAIYYLSLTPLSLKILTYIQYFFFLGFNWNWKIACHIISHEIKGEKKYGINTTGSDELKKTKAAGIDISHATLYMPANYLLLEEVFANLTGCRRTHFVDIGCGKGRALCVSAHNGFNKVTGIDFSKELSAKAEENLQVTKEKFPSLNFTVINKDAATVTIPEDADCIFFFNPFDQFMMKGVAKNILLSYNKDPRDIYIIYLNPLYKKELFDIGFKEIYYTIRMKYMEAVILYLPAA